MKTILESTVFGAALNYVANNGNALCICSQQPLVYADAATNYNLATAALTVGAGNGTYTVGPGPGGGLMLTIAAQNNVTVTTSGSSMFVAIVDTVHQALLVCTTVATQALVATNLTNIDPFTLTLSDPT